MHSHRPFHRPVRRPAESLETMVGGGDPAALSGVAHDTAAALLHRVRGSCTPETVERLIAYADEHGIDDVAELWAAAPAVTLPGALWRLYLLRHEVTHHREEAAYLFQLGLAADGGVNQAIAGSPGTPGPEDIAALATTILRGAFTGDFAVALHRAAAFATIMSFGCDALADNTFEDRRQRRRSTGYRRLADDLAASARLWQEGQLR